MKLYPHQLKSLELTEGMNRVGYFLDMGLGKTFVGSEKVKELNAKTNLVICQKSKINDWFNHFIEHYAVGNVVFDLTNKKQLEEFISFDVEGYSKIGIINYELAWRRKELLKLENFTLMLDESSMIQNIDAKQSKFVLKLKAENVILLSGTPVSGKYENLWTQINLLGWKISYKTYKNQYVNWKKISVGDVEISVVDKKNPYKNVDRLKKKLNANGCVFLKTEECFNLPKQNFIVINCKKPKEYGKFEKNKIVEIKEEVLIGDTILNKRLHLRQLASQYNENKLKAFSDLVKSTNDRLIVFYNFNYELEILKNLVEDKPISEVNGQRKDLAAYENESNSITFIQYQAGSMGLNLQKANKIIYFSLTEKSELFEQSKKRIHRIGQESPCFYYILQTKNSIDEEIYKALEQKRDFTDELFKRVDNFGE